MRKISYFFAIIIATGVIVTMYFLFFTTEKPNASDHAILALKPVTAREQQDMVLAQEEKESPLETGPLITQMTATDAQAKVLR